MSKSTSVLGTRLKRVDAKGKIRGEIKFLSDIQEADMRHAAPVFSQVAYGKLLGIDTRAVENDPDYIAFFSARDIPGENQVGVILEDQPLMADDVVRYVGDSVGILIAKTAESAQRLSRLVLVNIEPVPPLFSINESRDATDNFLHETNLACQHQVKRGDLDKAFAEADHIIEAQFETPFQEHYYLEPQACIAQVTPEGGIEILGSIQCPFYVQKAVSKALAIPFSKIRVEQSPTGGAFGGKEDIPSETCTRAALAALILKRPIKMVYDRATDIQLTSKRHPFQMHYKVGVSKSGKLLAAEIKLEENAGAYATLSSVVSYRSAMQALGPYVIDNISVESKSYYTNLPPTGAFRGFGSPQAAFGHERMMDVIATQLNMDPIEFRLQNIVRVDTQTLTGHHLISSVGAEETLKTAADACDWTNRESINNARWKTGYGVSLIHYGNCLGAAGWFMDGSGVKIKLHRDGSISVAFGLIEMGQGALTVVQQMTAEALGVEPSRITVLPTDTDQVPDSGPAVASRNVVMTGNAIRDAASKLLPILNEAAAELMQCDLKEITIEQGEVSNIRNNETLSFAELSNYLYLSNRPMDVLGWWHVPELDYDAASGVGEAYFTYSYATHIARVKVDTLTGQVKVDKLWASHDVGRAINPAGLEAQIEGGTAQGIGWALTEDFKVDEGKVLTDNLTTYLLPTALDVGEIESILVEDPEPEGPWGAKGIGEPAIIPTAAAIANAVSNAMGKSVTHIPIRPEHILDMVGE
ncbi:MAG: xanthine dehydrogenase family protein [Candidatus Marinimicrobia bacterium]|jgi:CO/xanthine dehydrogenase Mo-binding subunit|nr:xanthine dehydrogenase family protein [Candidatus Neomarinimicrobiota bacterium]MBT4361832.1 xanthine dehydrogenase family protein [Candidatus Neomarinimicrobiota bacterium]MBT4714412.1 xanthine dehydrogenase family protein [Candidatus Neomarinimicrobiota bacterium]MBT4946113.1 xanthine dehydrogenase family protein [Candidatus Neomarinimicrobiota bacterium]MBT5268912.1 xanthine dehydrogenase family protein [Candidatus Neomarinimicrobiota bacterium]